MTLWKVNCEEDKYPGMWQRWFRQQCVGIGWSPSDGFKLSGETEGGLGWKKARKALKKIEVGDKIIATLRGSKVGRLGVVTGKEIDDHQWNPLVPKSVSRRFGEMGRRVLVRWDLTVGPDNRDMVIELPESARFTSGELRPTVAEIHSRSVGELIKAMNDPLNWIGLLTHFDYERALSGYIAAYPHKLEDGLLPHPDKRVREKIFLDRTRVDVLLEDKNKIPVIVECKQNAPTIEHLRQLRHYMEHLKKETRGSVRGILVHGGARKLSRDVAVAAARQPRIEIIQYSLDVDFAGSY